VPWAGIPEDGGAWCAVGAAELVDEELVEVAALAIAAPPAAAAPIAAPVTSMDLMFRMSLLFKVCLSGRGRSFSAHVRDLREQRENYV
jgi:hypothetical protein